LFFLQKRDFQHKKFTIMKKYLLILIVAIFCLPNIANAQDLSLNVQKEAERQRLMMHRNSDGGRGAYSAYIAAAKIRQRKVEQQKAYLNAKLSAETVTDEATGTTTIKWGDGAMYRGQTYYGEIKGVGTMVYPDKSKYVGSWERDLPNGNGTFQTPEGITFTVNFENGIPHGKGVIQDLDGRKYSARWVRGVLKEKSIRPLKQK
jgi:hypothetical protein